ncbi:MAG: asparagine synthase-related protein [Pseudonocardiaceae bacterium]
MGETVSLRRLALWLAPPAVYGEFGPARPWQGAEIMSLRRTAPWPEPSPAGPAQLAVAFEAAIRELVNGHDVCAVSVSGGLDSLVVLVRLCQIFEGTGRRVVGVCAEMTDDCGLSNVSVLERLLRDLRLDCELLVVRRHESPDAAPAWSPDGPRLDALPEVNRLVCARAAAAGATLVLHGSGADELLASTRFLLRRFLRVSDWASAARYCGDTVFRSAGAALSEGVALVAPWLPGRPRALAYLAAECPYLAIASVPRFVGVRYRDVVTQWTDGWIDGLVSWHRDCHADWAAMAAWDLIPFETLRVRGAARAVALHYRYDGCAEFAYWRAKRLIVELFPERGRHVLPRYKQTFAAELSRIEPPRVAPVCTRLGLVDQPELVEEEDSLFLARVAAVEEWISRAERMNYDIA